MSEIAQVVVVATIVVKPGTEETVQTLLETSIKLTHDEDGCLAYALHRDVENPLQFVMVERWASKEALDAHFKTQNLATLFAALPEHLNAPPVIIRTKPVPVGDASKGVL